MKIRESEKKILKLSLQLKQLISKSKKMVLTDLVSCQPDRVVFKPGVYDKGKS